MRNIERQGPTRRGLSTKTIQVVDISSTCDQHHVYIAKPFRANSIENRPYYACGRARWLSFPEARRELVHEDDKACNRVLVLESAVNAAVEIQARGRAIRVRNLRTDTSRALIALLTSSKATPEYFVSVVRVMTGDSNDMWKDHRQRDKAIMELASRATHPEMRSLLVKLLNRGNEEVQRAHDPVIG